MRDISKQPQWVQKIIARQQSRITTLLNDVEYLKQERDSVDNGTSPISYTVDYETEHYLPARAKVTFRANGHNINVSVENDSGIAVSADRGLKVLPKMSNSIWVDIE